MRRAEPLRPRRPLRPVPASRSGRGQRDRTLLIGLGLVFGLLTLAWFDAGSAAPATPPTAGGPR